MDARFCIRTPTLLYQLECDDAYEEIKSDIVARFDTSNYAMNNQDGMPRVSKKVPGLMKDENNGDAMTEFVGLSKGVCKGGHTRSGRPVSSACAGRIEQVSRTTVVPPHAPPGLTRWSDGASTRSGRLRKKLFILYRIDMEMMPMESFFPGEHHTKFHVNRTIINEISFRLWE